jgi:hypothetical protein
MDWPGPALKLSIDELERAIRASDSTTRRVSSEAAEDAGAPDVAHPANNAARALIRTSFMNASWTASRGF